MHAGLCTSSAPEGAPGPLLVAVPPAPCICVRTSCLWDPTLRSGVIHVTQSATVTTSRPGAGACSCLLLCSIPRHTRTAMHPLYSWDIRPNRQWCSDGSCACLLVNRALISVGYTPRTGLSGPRGTRMFRFGRYRAIVHTLCSLQHPHGARGSLIRPSLPLVAEVPHISHPLETLSPALSCLFKSCH